MAQQGKKTQTPQPRRRRRKRRRKRRRRRWIGCYDLRPSLDAPQGKEAAVRTGSSALTEASAAASFTPDVGDLGVLEGSD